MIRVFACCRFEPPKRYLKQEEEPKKVLLVAGDIYRPAAVDQLISLGERIDVSESLPVPFLVVWGTAVPCLGRRGGELHLFLVYSPLCLSVTFFFLLSMLSLGHSGYSTFFVPKRRENTLICVLLPMLSLCQSGYLFLYRRRERALFCCLLPILSLGHSGHCTFFVPKRREDTPVFGLIPSCLLVIPGTARFFFFADGGGKIQLFLF